MSLSRTERERLIQQYADGAVRLEGALATVPAAARRGRHAASGPPTRNAAARIRYVVCEPEPLVLGYDENAWAVALDYHGQPLEPVLATVRAVRAHTTAVIRRLPEAAWAREGRHTASGRYTAEDWLQIYAEHLENHARQIEANVAAWHGAGRPS